MVVCRPSKLIAESVNAFRVGFEYRNGYADMKVVGLSGPSGSGKSYLSTKLHNILSDVNIIQQDSYFIDPDQCPPDANFCDLKYLHVEEFIADVSDLASGCIVEVPTIDFGTFRRTGKHQLLPKEWLIVEGMTIFRLPEIIALCDSMIYLAPDLTTIRERKSARDLIERNKSQEIVARQLQWISAEYHRDLETLSADVHIIKQPEKQKDLLGVLLPLIR